MVEGAVMTEVYDDLGNSRFGLVSRADFLVLSYHDPMIWSEVLADKKLQDMPYKIELNERGKIEMSPATNIHGLLQGEIIIMLAQFLKGGKRIPECSVQTSKGVKVADVTWLSDEFITKNKYVTPYLIAPELCVEIVSPSNTKEEILEKIALYLETGAIEVWVCNLQGNLSFYDVTGKLELSKLVPEFPEQLEL